MADSIEIVKMLRVKSTPNTLGLPKIIVMKDKDFVSFYTNEESCLFMLHANEVNRASEDSLERRNKLLPHTSIH